MATSPPFSNRRPGAPAPDREPSAPSKPVRASGQRPSAARDRLLLTADRLFYADGIRAVGVDRLIAESQVTRMTFYRHFPSKEDLIVAYLNRRSLAERSRFAQARSVTPGDPRAVFRTVVAQMVAAASATSFRGCPYINAAAEYSDPAHPVRQAVDAHREWFRLELTELVRQIGHPDPEAVATQFVILRDGAMVGCYLNDANSVAAALLQAGRGVIAYRGQ